MKKTKLYAKKTLSVFLAVMMLMSAWVFVPGEHNHASAVSADSSSTPSYSSYNIKLSATFSNCGKGGSIIILYYPVDQYGGIDTSSPQTYTLVNSLTQYSSGVRYTFDTANDATRALDPNKSFSSGGYDSGAENGPVNGWPYGIRWNAASGASVAIHSMYVGSNNVNVLANGTWTASGETREKHYNDSEWTSYASEWTVPALSKVGESPASTTLNIPNGGSSAGATFSATFTDQYGTEWPVKNYKCSFEPSLDGGASVQWNNNSGKYVSVTATDAVFSKLSNYNPATGKGSATLKIQNGSVSTSCNVTFQSSKYSLSYKNIDGQTVKTLNDYGYYGVAVDCAALAPANTSARPIAGNDGNHQLYSWNTSEFVTKLEKNTVLTEIKNGTEKHSFLGYEYADATNHKQVCSICGYEKVSAHTPGATRIATAATCGVPGSRAVACADCGTEYKTEVIPALTHDFTSGIFQEVEEGKDGTHNQKCIYCEAYGWGTVANECAKHSWILDSNDAAGCEADGKEYYKCNVCGATSYEKVIPMTGHKTGTAHPAQAKSCGVDGWSDYWTCNACGDVFANAELTVKLDKTDADSDNIPDSVEIQADAHDFSGSLHIVSSGKDGEHNRACKNCGAAFGLVVNGVQTEGATEKHNWDKDGNGTVDEEDADVVASTCTKEGKATYKCTCGQSYDQQLAKAEHSMIKTDAVAPDCNNTGNNEYNYCTSCRKYYKADGETETTVEAETLEKLVHTWDKTSGKDKLIAEATCAGPAVYQKHCMYCGTEMFGTYEDGASLDHSFTGELKYNGDGTHSTACANVENCNTYSTPVSCNKNIITNVNDNQHKLACACGNYSLEDHSWGSPVPGEESGTMKIECWVCNAEKTTECDFENVNEVKATCDYEGSIFWKCKNENCSNYYVETTPALGHEWKEGNEDEKYVKSSANCETNAVFYKYCERCNSSSEGYTGETWTKANTKLTHDWSAWTQSVDEDGNYVHTRTCSHNSSASCTQTVKCFGGEATCKKAAVCAVCKNEYGTVNSEKHNNTRLIARVDSTCTKKGTEPYYFCDDCEKAVEEIIEIPVVPHSYTGAWEQIEGQNKHQKTCSVCKASGDNSGAEIEDCYGGYATCKTPAVCEGCNKSYGTTNANNHETQKSTLVGVIEATCTKEGYTGDRVYNCCGVVKIAGEKIEKADHKFTVEVEGTKQAATCKDEGKVTLKCEDCSETKEQKLELDYSNHISTEEELIGFVEANCSTEGYTGDRYYKCCYDSEATAAENKKALIAKGEVVSVNGQHTLGTAVPEYMLSLDGEGKPVILEEKNDEGKVISKSLKVKTTAPEYADVKDEAGNVIKGKISYRHEDGKWYHVQLCENCDEIIYTACYTYKHTFNCVETDECEICEGLCSLVDPDKHPSTLSLVSGTPATCIATGVMDYYVCETCDRTYLDQAGKTAVDLTVDKNGDKIPDALVAAKVAHKIDWSNGKVVKEPTCGQNGTTRYPCATKDCIHCVELDDISSEGVHEWSEDYKIVREATCFQTGYQAQYCKVCDQPKTGTYTTIPTLDHKYGEPKEEKGTSCTAPTTLTYTCTNEYPVFDDDGEPVVDENGKAVTIKCTHSYVEKVYDDESGHKWVDVEGSVSGDCASGIVKQQQCSVCKATQVVSVDTNTHELIIKVRVEPTCEMEGYIIRVCKNCGYETEKEILPVDTSIEGHVVNYDEYKTLSKATCTEAEKRQYTCIYCGEKVVYAYGEMLDHTWLVQDEEIATCERAGHSEYERCVRCLAERGDKVVYEPLGHADNDDDGKCDACNSLLYDKDSKGCGCMCHKEGWLTELLYKILNFFWRLFKINPICSCGEAHY